MRLPLLYLLLAVLFPLFDYRALRREGKRVKVAYFGLLAVTAALVVLSYFSYRVPTPTYLLVSFLDTLLSFFRMR